MQKYLKNIASVALLFGFVSWCIGAVIGVCEYTTTHWHFDENLRFVEDKPHFWYLIPAIVLVPFAIIGLGIAVTKEENNVK